MHVVLFNTPFLAAGFHEPCHIRAERNCSNVGRSASRAGRSRSHAVRNRS